MLKFWCKVVSELEMSERVFVTIVVDHQKGSPGTKGAAMMLTRDGEQFGTMGGGIMELNMIERGKAMLESADPKNVLETRQHRNVAADKASGLICGGSQTQVLMVLDADDLPVVKQAVDGFRSSHLLIDEGGISFADSGDCGLNGGCELIATVDKWTVKLELLNRKRIAIVGCGHCGNALARQMDFLDYDVTIMDPREEVLNSKSLPEGIEKHQVSYAEAGDLIARKKLTFVVVMTPSYPDDVDAVETLLSHPFPFIGVMGSPVKLVRIKKELGNRGISKAEIERLVAPVGLDIDSDTPQEIAVSIAAQILLKSRQEGLR